MSEANTDSTIGSAPRVTSRKTSKDPETWAAFVWSGGQIIHITRDKHATRSDATADARMWIKQNQKNPDTP